MADLNEIQSAGATKIVGSSSTGVENTPVNATSAGGLHSNLRDNAGTELGTITNPIYTATGASSIPSIRVAIRQALAASATVFSTQLISARTAIRRLHVGGRTACEATLIRYSENNTQLVPGGGFNTAPDAALWTNTSQGSSAGLSWATTPAQAYAGSGSVAMTFTQSDSNNYPEITYNFSTPVDLSKWRYLRAAVRVTVAGGGSQTRTVQLRVTSGTAVRIWQITGTTTTAPFSTEQWQLILGELENPTSTAGSGTFDINSVNSISLRLTDGGNKSGTIYWDDVRYLTEMEILEKIYTPGQTNQLTFDPTIVFEVGQTLALMVRNSGATTGEVQAAVAGVSI
jgi:hypothetical protein